VSEEPSIIKDYPLAILTPNAVEFKRLLEATNVKESAESPIMDLSQKLGSVTIVQKGKTDIISNGQLCIECNEQGGLKRSGGQGDILSGSIGTFASWAHMFYSKNKEQKQEVPYMVAAAYMGCVFTRRCGKVAFDKHKRSMTSPNIIEEIGSSFEKMFPLNVSKL